jgi:CheY-like chemotaxis protein
MRCSGTRPRRPSRGRHRSPRARRRAAEHHPRRGRRAARPADVRRPARGAGLQRHLRRPRRGGVRLPREVELVLLDAMLPGRDGWSICREIKDHHDAMLPIIMVTARTAPDDVVRTFAAGADDYVAKPFHVAELTARIESRLRVHRAESRSSGPTSSCATSRRPELRAVREGPRRRRGARAPAQGARSPRAQQPVRHHGPAEHGAEPPPRAAARRGARQPGAAAALIPARARGAAPAELPRRPRPRDRRKLAQRLRNAWDPDRRVEVRFRARSAASTNAAASPSPSPSTNSSPTRSATASPTAEAAPSSSASQRRDDRVRLQVADDGIGVASTQLPEQGHRQRPLHRRRPRQGGARRARGLRVPTTQGTTVTVEFPVD